jgi:hypothetical protein
MKPALPFALHTKKVVLLPATEKLLALQFSTGVKTRILERPNCEGGRRTRIHHRVDSTQNWATTRRSSQCHRLAQNPQQPQPVLPAGTAAGRTDDEMNPNRTAIEKHWQASEDGDIEAEHALYAVDAILDYPQSGERFRGRTTIAAQRGGHPAERHFTVLRISGDGSLWVSECIITYNGVPSFSVSIMEFAGESVVHETQYFANSFSAPASRAALAESMPGRPTEKA